jgi:DNA-binding GntR family transcriptional regulator
LNASERAYGGIRSLIVNGQLAPGFHLREGELAEQLGVSRTPVREALRRLAAEGLVESRRNRGAVVGTLSGAALEEVAEARASLEGAAAHRAASRISPRDLDRLTRLDEQMWALAEAGDPDSLDSLAQLNREFHDIVANAAASPSLTSLLRSINYVPLVRRTFRHYARDALFRSMVSHRELLEALSTGNGPWAEAVMRAHIWAAAHTQRFDSRSRSSEPSGYDEPASWQEAVGDPRWQPSSS